MHLMHVIGKYVFLSASISTLLIIAACTVGPDYKEPELALPGGFSELSSATQPSTRATSLSATTQPATNPSTNPSVQIAPDFQNWWKTFNDPELNSLIERAAEDNLDVIAAEARVVQARGNRGVVSAGLFPQVNGVGQYNYSRISPGAENLPPGFSFPLLSNLWQAGLDASWELDIFGGTRRGIEAADADIQSAVEDRRDVEVTLLSEVALNYVQLRGSQLELAIANHNLSSQEQTLQLIRSKFEGGLIPGLDVAQQEAQVATTASAIPTFQSQIRANIHQLGILLAKDPGALSEELTPAGLIPVGPTSVPPGLPSDLVRRRPDVRRAERQLASATAQIGVATADLFPKVTITGNLGVEAMDLKNLFKYANRYYGIGPGVSWDIFDAGKIAANIKVQNGREAELLADYEKAVLTSLQEVDDALVAYNQEQSRLQSLKDAVEANQRAVDLSTELFDKGSTDFLSVLDAQRTLFAAQDAEARSEQQVSTDLIALYKALGGGWKP